MMLRRVAKRIRHRMLKLIQQGKRSLPYYFFVGLVITAILKMEDYMDGDLDGLSLMQVFGSFVKEFVLIITAVVGLSLAALQIIKILNQVYPWDKQPGKRFLSQVVIVLILVAVLTVIISAVARYLVVVPDDNDNDFEILTIIMLFISLFMIFSFHEFLTLKNERELLRYQTEVLEKQNYLTKYEALRHQISPHFLFNSLNVLSGLIYIDASKSDLFIKKFAEIFRYVLELNQEVAVPVKRELEFIESYLFLQRIRYGDNLKIDTLVSADVFEKLIPPLTLQLVFENAIKHNIVAQDQQLEIKVSNTHDTLIIKNSFQPRAVSAPSTGIGQNNLLEKYRLVNDRVPRFFIENGLYTVELPLINAV
jgi:two-component system, LytTR family, sensor kinase